ncbi:MULTISPECIES: hypothetical protein [unclassified Shewanella]|uniref:hypothetical protein n=1 Tax=unclassified Shewanella TaxID=196818 RepID=UPI0005A065DE|nr:MULTISPECIES: hypothetical protein [unclassified Shewanella]KIO37774.1 hypothetical protein DB48_02625 [Shewanella sp. cp20]MCG9722185.1 hypothetical protein [Shewanella sp. Isolate7]
MQQAFEQTDGRWQLTLDGEEYGASRQLAAQCGGFIADDEDEQVDDIERSCVNCARRRWLIDAIECTFL